MDAEYHVTSAKYKSHPNVPIKSQGDILTLQQSWPTYISLSPSKAATKGALPGLPRKLCNVLPGSSGMLLGSLWCCLIHLYLFFFFYCILQPKVQNGVPNFLMPPYQSPKLKYFQNFHKGKFQNFHKGKNQLPPLLVQEIEKEEKQTFSKTVSVRQ